MRGARGRGADRFVDRLLRRRRPRAFDPTEEDVAVVRTAIELVAARPGADRPRQEFVDELRGRIAAQQAAAERESEPAAAPAVVRPWTVTLTPGRRRFLRAGAVAASAFTAGFATDRCLGPSSSSDAPAAADGAGGGEIMPTTGAWQTVVAAADLPEGAVRDFDLGAVVGVVHRTGGRLRAVSAVCTHQACRLGLDDARTTLVCPCHGATFALEGAPLHNFRSHHPLPPLPRLAVREHQGQIQVYGPADHPLADGGPTDHRPTDPGTV